MTDHTPTIAERRRALVINLVAQADPPDTFDEARADSVLRELEAFDQANGLTLVGTIEFPIFDQDRGALGVGRVELFGRLAGLRTAKEKADELVAELEERSRAAGG